MGKAGGRVQRQVGSDVFALADLNNDGWIDLYVPAYLPKAKMEGMNIFNKEGYGATSLMLLNNGDNTFKDITKESGLGMSTTPSRESLSISMMTTSSIWWSRTTPDTSRRGKNLGNCKFVDAPNPNSSPYSYPMGVGVGDYNNDGRADLFFSNVGPTVPGFMAKGDLRPDQVFNPKLLFFRNDGGFTLTDVGAQTKTADYEFSWGILMEDFNLDGRQDIAIAQNFIDFPGHKVLPPARTPPCAEGRQHLRVGGTAGWRREPVVCDHTARRRF